MDVYALVCAVRDTTYINSTRRSRRVNAEEERVKERQSERERETRGRRRRREGKAERDEFGRTTE